MHVLGVSFSFLDPRINQPINVERVNIYSYQQKQPSKNKEIYVHNKKRHLKKIGKVELECIVVYLFNHLWPCLSGNRKD